MKPSCKTAKASHQRAHSAAWREHEQDFDAMFHDEKVESRMKILKGHVSPETAYLVADYPYGFSLRCQIRYWLEYKKDHGVRLVSQTTNPKRNNSWNKPKASTYSSFGGCMYLDENDHVQWSGLSEYTDGKEAQAWREQFGEGCPSEAKERMNQWVDTRIAYDRLVAEGKGSGEAAALAAREVAKGILEKRRSE